MSTLTDSMSRSLSRYLWPNVLRHSRRLKSILRSFSTTCEMPGLRDDHSFLLSVRECPNRHCRGDYGDVGDDSKRVLEM